MAVIGRQNITPSAVAKDVTSLVIPETTVLVLIQVECITRACFNGQTATPTLGHRLFPGHHPQPYLIRDVLNISYIAEDGEECGGEVIYIGDDPDSGDINTSDIWEWLSGSPNIWQGGTTGNWLNDEVSGGSSSSVSFSSQSSSSSRSSASSSSASLSSVSTSSQSSSASSVSSQSSSSSSSASSSPSSISTSSSSQSDESSSSSSASTSSRSSSSASSKSSHSSSSESSASSISTSSVSSLSSSSSSLSSSSASFSSQSSDSSLSSLSSLSSFSSLSSSGQSQPTQPDTEISLENPPWVLESQSYEGYNYPKLGQTYNGTTGCTNFIEDTVLVAHNTAELHSHLATARSGGINAIYLDAVANGFGEFQFPENPFSGNGWGYPWEEPLVIRTHPDSPQRAQCFRLRQNSYVNGAIALVDLKFNDTTPGDAFYGCRFIGGGEHVLIECCETSLDIQGSRSGGVPIDPMFNGQIRLNSIFNHCWPFGNNLVHGFFMFHTLGLLAEGNVLHHNGWCANATRDTASGSGGASQQRHNCYFTPDNIDLYFRFNVSSRAAATGCLAKGSGKFYNNLFLNNPIHLQMGAWADGFCSDTALKSGRASKNIFIGSDVVNTGVPRSVCIWIECSNEALITSNVALDDSVPNSNSAFVRLTGNYPVTAQIELNLAKDFPVGGLPSDYIDNRVTAGVQVNLTTGVNDPTASVSADAQSQANIFKSDAYINGLVTANHGVNPLTLHQQMLTILNGVDFS